MQRILDWLHYPAVMRKEYSIRVMKQILVYSDSLTWGIIPSTRKRLNFDDRWPGVLENSLNRHERKVRLIENCLNGRRTTWDDPLKPGQNGLEGIEQVIH